MGPPVASLDAYSYRASGNVIFGCVSRAFSAVQMLNYRTGIDPRRRLCSPPPPSMQFNMEYSGAPSPNKTPRRKNRSSGYSPPFFPVALPSAPVPNLDILLAGAGRLSQYWIPQQENEQLCLDNFPDMASVALLGCDWARVAKCLCSSMAGPSLIQCKVVGCVRLLHHMCQMEWESEDPRREAHGSRSLRAYHHPALAGLSPAPTLPMNVELDNFNDCDTEWLLETNKSVRQVYRQTVTPTPDGNYVLPLTTVCSDLVFDLALSMTMATGALVNNKMQTERINEFIEKG
jgi:hypothetical protein